MSTPSRRRFQPVNGVRCRLCSAMVDDTHVHHPWWQILAWVWHSHWLWRVYMVTLTLGVLTLLFTAARIFAAQP